ncbi:MAG: cyclic nucleotide-binding domain-containing protein [Deltaproteobacteria bacterium]|nr:cyclic nucleotide-binding domain-containing protein [Myxococcales bacterium]MDP3215371.1 cyclic nucleotide-binding domain-containing protein [Deltaproteobacteria bacterium]
MRREQLRDIGLFGGLDDESLDLLTRELRASLFDPGALVMKEGDHAREMFVVLSGELEVVRHSVNGTEGRVALLGPGNWVGEMSIVDPQPRSATVRALAPSILLVVTTEDLDRLYRRDMKSYLLVVLNIAREMARRLRVADGMIAGFLSSAIDQNLGYRR